MNITERVASYINLTPTQRDTTYRELRDWLRDTYDRHIGPRATRSRLREIEQRRAAGGRHVRTADRLERQMEEDLAEYDHDVTIKWCLAILTGRYDAALVLHGDAGSSSAPSHQQALTEAARVRLAEISDEDRTRILAQADVRWQADQQRRALLLDYPPAAWGSSMSHAERVARWRTRSEDDRLRDPRAREKV